MFLNYQLRLFKKKKKKKTEEEKKVAYDAAESSYRLTFAHGPLLIKLLLIKISSPLKVSVMEIATLARVASVYN